MAYGDSTRVRNLTGNISTTNLSAADVTQAIAYGDSIVNTFTAKDDWTTTDVEYEMVQTASEYFAASYCIKRFFMGDDSVMAKARSLEEQGHQILDILRKTSTNLVHVVTQAYRTHNLNPNITPYRSIAGGNTGTDDSDL